MQYFKLHPFKILIKNIIIDSKREVTVINIDNTKSRYTLNTLFIKEKKEDIIFDTLINF